VLSAVLGGVLLGLGGPIPTPIGAGPRYHPPAAPARVLRGETVAGLRCRADGPRFGVHLELFAHGRVVVVPAGIGVAAPRRRVGAFVRPRGCSYPLRTLTPTGIVEVRPGARLTLGRLFAVWGQPLSPTSLAGFSTRRSAPVRAYVAGRRWRGRLGAIPLRRHAQIVLELGRFVPPHRSFRFPAAAHRPIVPRGTTLAADTRGRLRVLDRRGNLVRRLLGALPSAVQALELGPDRRHAFVSILGRERPARLYELDLASGAKRLVGRGVSPSLSPDRTRLAFITTAVEADVVEEVALVVRDLRSGRSRLMPFGTRLGLGTPPDIVLNWSPDGQRIAVFDGETIRLVDAAHATRIDTEPAIGVPLSAGREPSLAPVFLDGQTLVVLENCCIGRQRLVTIDVGSGAQALFATLAAPPETIRRVRPGLLMTVTALGQLAFVSRNHVRVVATHVAAAALS
jgi:hypothetical protein